MNYGHTDNQNPAEPTFFTAGVGNSPESDNPLPPESNLEADSFAIDRDYTNLGSAALRSNELPMPETSDSRPELGQIIDLAMPPLNEHHHQPEDHRATTEPLVDFNSIKAHFADGKFNGDRDLGYLKAEETKLSQDGNADSFYETIRQARLAMNGELKEGA